MVALLAAVTFLLSFFLPQIVNSAGTRSLDDRLTASILSGGFIVEFEEPAGSDTSARFYQNLTRNKIAAEHRMNLSFKLLHGVSFRLDAAQDVKKAVGDISSMQIVKNVWPIQLHHTMTMQVGNMGSPSDTVDTFPPHVMTGVDKLHAEGISGEGVFVALIDTGVDYTHPALGGGFGAGFKIARGHDLVGNLRDPNGIPHPDPDPLDQCDDHGTHVAGIVGANPNSYNFTGVAPKATLGMYRALSCSGLGGDDIVTAAFMRAFEDSADVISSSVGSIRGWSEWQWSMISRIVDAGTPCIFAAGNHGDGGPFSRRAPAGGDAVILVGSVDSTELLSFRSKKLNSRPNNRTGGFMSTFTQWSPTNDLHQEPEISAPGGSILSTVRRSVGGYGIYNGTSMAAPFIAGVVALMKQARPHLTVPEIRALLATTANPVKFNNGNTTYEYLAPTVQQGGGLVNASAAVHTLSVLSVPNLVFNDSAHFAHEANFSITNHGSVSVTYDLGYLNAATAYTFAANTTTSRGFPPRLVESGASLAFASPSLTVEAEASAEILVTLTPPMDLDATRIPIYSGFITISGTDGSSLSLPYMGVATSMVSIPVLDPRHGFPMLSSSRTRGRRPVLADTVFTVPKSMVRCNGSIPDLPKLYTELIMPSTLVRADLVPAILDGNETVILGVRSLGNIEDFPAQHQPKNLIWWKEFDGTMADGTRAPPGNYTILVRALRIFGNAEREEDYDAVSTVQFRIEYC